MDTYKKLWEYTWAVQGYDAGKGMKAKAKDFIDIYITLNEGGHGMSWNSSTTPSRQEHNRSQWRLPANGNQWLHVTASKERERMWN